MELDFFISQSNLSQNSVKDKWLDTSSLKVRSFTQFESYSVTGLSGDANFSFFFTFEKKDNKSATLISNTIKSGGFSLNFNDNNKLFLHAHYPNSYSYLFDNIDLAKKNCLSFTRTDNIFYLLNYDLESRKIYQKDYCILPDDIEISGGSYTIGYNQTGTNQTSLYGVSGLFDQMVLFDQPVNFEESLNIFSGFLPFTKTTVTGCSTYSLESNFQQSENPKIPDQDIFKLSGFLYNIKNYLPAIDSSCIVTTSKAYRADITGYTDHLNSRIFWSGSYFECNGIDCSQKGATIYTINENTYSPYSPPALSGRIDFTDKILFSINTNSEINTNHFFTYKTYNYPTINNYLLYNFLEKKSLFSNHSFSSLDASYLKQFYFDGVSTQERFCNLSYYESKSFDEIGINLPFDSFAGKFMVPDDFLNGYNVYWGPYQISYSLNNTYIEPTEVNIRFINGEKKVSYVNINATKEYSMIFDKTNSTPINISTNFFSATGNYPRGGGIVFANNDSFNSKPYRLQNRNYIQTSEFSIIHNKKRKITSTFSKKIFENYNSEWLNVMEAIITPEQP